MPLVVIEGIGKLISVRMDFTFEEDEVNQFLAENNIDEDDFENELYEFILDRLGIYVDHAELI